MSSAPAEELVLIDLLKNPHQYENVEVDIQINDKTEEESDLLIVSSSVIKDTNREAKERWKDIFKRKPAPKPSSPPKEPAQKVPYYKKIPGTGFYVDAFRYGDIKDCTAYFLTHFHSDHYVGLKQSFRNRLYCSKITARLVEVELKVPKSYINVIEMETPTRIQDITVTFIDANQLNDELINHPQLMHVFNTVYLDTTYCDPDYKFPDQKIVIENLCSVIYNAIFPSHSVENFGSNYMILIGTYKIGKERVVEAIATMLNSLVYATAEKSKTISMLDFKELAERMERDPHKAKVHIVSMMNLGKEKILKYMEPYKNVKRLFVVHPTGWTNIPDSADIVPEITETVRSDGTSYDTYFLNIPYSEHSSYTELEKFVTSIKAERVIPTVASRRGFPFVAKQVKEWKLQQKFI